MLHTFFGNSCLDLKGSGHNGIAHTPREWLIAPLGAIKQASQMMVTGYIINYRFDAVSHDIVEIVNQLFIKTTVNVYICLPL